MKSLQARLLLATVAGTTLVLLAFGLALDVGLETMLWRAFDQALIDKARALAAITDRDNQEVNLEFVERRLPEFERAQRPECYQVWIDGAAPVRSPSLGTHDLGAPAGTLDAPELRSVRLPDGRPGRLVGVRFVPRREDHGEPAASQPTPLREVTLVLGRDTLDVERALARLRWLLGGAGAGALLASALVLAWLVPRGLRPLNRLAAGLQAIGARNLAARLDAPDAPAELRPVVQRLNELLARLEAGFTRERSFSADVAHELRTPLAGLRTTLEVALSRARAPEDYQRVLHGALAITQRLGALVENLLTLARAEAGQLAVAARPVALADLLREAWAPFPSAAAARGLRVEWQIEPAGTLHTDADKLRQILANLFDNAVAYADRGGWVRIEAGAADGQARITVSNSGSAVPAADAPRTLDRFWRGDRARTATGEHFGLGLSLCRRMAELLGGRVTVTSEDGGTFQVCLAFPAAPAAPVVPARAPEVVGG